MKQEVKARLSRDWQGQRELVKRAKQSKHLTFASKEPLGKEMARSGSDAK